MKAQVVSPVIAFEHKRDAYGFAVRPQHVQRYREYANIYKEEEEERSERWNNFLEHQAETAQLPVNALASEIDGTILEHNRDANDHLKDGVEGGEPTVDKPGSEGFTSNVLEKELPASKESRVHRVQIWTEIRPSLCAIEDMMSLRVKKKGSTKKNEQSTESAKLILPFEEARSPKGASEEDSEDEFYDVEKSESSDHIQDTVSSDSSNVTAPEATVDAPLESSFPWKEELEVLVRGGVPMALRGELWQAFVGVKTRRVQNYYQDLLKPPSNAEITDEEQMVQSDKDSKASNADSVNIPEKWKGQIEKDLPRTFPGHPALDENGRNALRRLLTAYARHNPSVGYCQAMNFFAGLLLLLMPEENAFWTLMGIIDDYFDGYYSEEMIESQVDQLVFEELVRERFPKLVNHLDFLGVQIAWVTGPWFLSIFMNMLPWESVLRVWDVLLFEGNRVMLFRTALALMELYGPALVTTKDAGDAVTLLQSLTGSTFDSSQLVLTACMGYQNVNEKRLQELRNKHRAAVRATVEERSKGLRAWRDSQDGIVISLTGDLEIDSGPDLQEQVVWLKVELCKLLEEKRSAVLRAEELETALMEMVKQDNRRELSAKVEKLEQEVADLQRAVSDKQEQESVMLQVLMRVEQEQRVTEDARRFAEQDAAAQKYASQVLQEKYEEAMASLAEMEKRAVMAESMLEATLQYQSGQVKTQPSPRSLHSESSPRFSSNQESTQELPTRKISLLSRPFGLGWRDRNKQQGKPANADEPNDVKPTDEIQSPSSLLKETNGIESQGTEQTISG
ncbi:rab GTPase-activating protein 1-like isoform X5 [Rhodamnia argentea]|uniref:Rab GTPase-activating protein 1-like isoform X5 n=1 Tax=Rhodamnia argentea TaxID=178133 RepID=A0ABM3HT86_9MYRT|nr:rab GTPase-activating protein 1-like isoform X5 [Rhodamnia argentea]